MVSQNSFENPLQHAVLEPRSKLLIACGLVSALVACSPDNGSASRVPAGSIAVASNTGAANDGTVTIFDGSLEGASRTLTTGTNENIAFDAAGNLYQVGDGTVEGIRVFNNATERPDGDVYSDSTDRQISTETGKGLIVIDSINRFLVADLTNSAVEVFSTTAGEGAAAINTLNLGGAGSVWDMSYDPDSDKLYVALTGGSLDIFDGFSATADTVSDASRNIVPVDGSGTQVSANFHGVGSKDGTVIVSDVGAATTSAQDGFNTDGAIFRFTDDGTIDGNIAPADYRVVKGVNTGLGNPVDLLVSGEQVIIAEKANDTVLVFDGLFGEGEEDLAPSYSQDFTKPESIAFVPPFDELDVDVTDITDTSSVTSLAVVQNPAANMLGLPDANAGTILKLALTDLSEESSFNANSEASPDFTSVENVQYDSLGNAYATFDVTNQTGAANSGVIVLNLLAERGADDIAAPTTDRVIQGANTGLVSPKGLEIVSSQGAMIVADTGAGALVVHSLSADGDAVPLFTVADTGSAAIWDVDYDPATDTLFAAGTAGDLLVYRNFFDSGAMATPQAFRLNSDGAATSNLHGIIHVASSNQLIVTDVGSAADADDGLLYVVNNASGTPSVAATITGPAVNNFGNPVDIAFDGNTVFIAEKSDGQVYAYSGILSQTSDGSLEPDLSAAASAPESVSLAR